MKKLGLITNLWLPVIFWCLLIFYFSSIPNLRTAQNPFWDEIIRSTLHGIFYAILYLLFFRALNFQKKEKDFWLPLILASLYGLFDEIHQSFVPTRSFQLRDLIVDFSGAALGGLMIWKLLPKAPSKLKNWAKKLGGI
jgi:VanZ family protein